MTMPFRSLGASSGVTTLGHGVGHIMLSGART